MNVQPIIDECASPVLVVAGGALRAVRRLRRPTNEARPRRGTWFTDRGNATVVDLSTRQAHLVSGTIDRDESSARPPFRGRH